MFIQVKKKNEHFLKCFKNSEYKKCVQIPLDGSRFSSVIIEICDFFYFFYYNAKSGILEKSGFYLGFKLITADLLLEVSRMSVSADN